MYVIYEGTRGRTQGEAKERSPAVKAIIPEICCGWLMVS
jgi:hypothetical protein